jgi:hypothetical protein
MHRPVLHRRAPARLLLVALATAAAIGSARAQDEGGLAFSVRPSGVQSEAHERQARLLARMQASEYLFRHICRQCGMSRDPLDPARPFEPLSALGGRP